MRRTILVLFAAIGVASAGAQVLPELTLTDCRQMAIQNGASAKISAEAQAAADLNKQAALAAMFPKISANAAYTWNSKNATLLANQMDFGFGTATVGKDGSSSFEWSESSAMNQLAQKVYSDPTLYNQVTGFQNEAGQMVADAYQQLYNALNLDMTHVVVGQVGITQPIYVGGRLRELYNIAKATEQVAVLQGDNKRDDIIVSVDEAYWRVVAVQSKKRLANQYYDLLVKMEGDVTELVTEGLATQSDLLKVKAKRGEAEVKKMQAENGLILSKMALCQLCGLPLETDIHVDSTGLGEIALHDTIGDVEAIINSRAEMQLLEQAEKIAKSNTRIMAAGLQPNIMASANYIYTNPNVDNGFSNDWKGKGFFSAGVVVNIPIAHADDILRVKAAKHEAALVTLKKEEAREMLNLQITQAKQKMMEATQKVAMTEMGVKNAEEVLHFATEAFEAGMATTSDVLQAQTAWLSASSDHIDANVEAKVCETYFQKYTSTLRY